MFQKQIKKEKEQAKVQVEPVKTVDKVVEEYRRTYSRIHLSPSSGITHHGALDGLLDDDHLQYVLVNKKIVLGNFHFSPLVTAPTTTTANGWKDYITAHPYFSVGVETISKIGIFILQGGGVGAKVNLGIYESDDSGYPSNRIAAVNNLDASNDVTWIEGDVDIELSRGLYYTAFLTNNNNVWVADYWCYQTPIGVSLTGSMLHKWYVDYAFANLPSTYPAGGQGDIYCWGIALKIDSIT